MNNEMKFTKLSMKQMFNLKERYREMVATLNADYAELEMQHMEDIAEYQRKLDLAMAVIENLRLTAENCGKLTEEMTDMIDDAIGSIQAVSKG